LLGFDEHQGDEAEDGTFDCGECGAEVASEETFCPKCGTRFEGD
jgi:predicted amidophosphoribosyltransferase